LLAQQVRAKLQAAGYHVLLTRSRDTFVELPDRATLANRAKADLFLSLHFNSIASRGAAAEGIETFCLTPHRASSTHAPVQSATGKALAGHKTTDESALLGLQIQKAFVRRLGMADRGVKHARFVVLRDAAMPPCGSGPVSQARGDLRKITDASTRGRMADAIVRQSGSPPTDWRLSRALTIMPAAIRTR
jgi:N-acetylmuramoyl-L-alanine amidase